MSKRIHQPLSERRASAPVTDSRYAPVYRLNTTGAVNRQLWQHPGRRAADIPAEAVNHDPNLTTPSRVGHTVPPAVRLLTRSVLLQVARERRLISESELLRALRRQVPEASHSSVDRALEAAVEDDGHSGRPLLASLVTDDSRAWPWPGLVDGLVRFRRPLPQTELEDWPLRATTERLAALDYYAARRVPISELAG
ncbi:hypothetical protein ACN2MM_10355 [Alkalilimnicola ehrlichii MLHE-1]|uniref:Uncharacterized protein n=1 Tax=Alkalilimnicola ehrlichii (strain ATCC BAA-1101 / DSM 17681 / MLHE-1) TaxID=187272 RepID=Q0A7C3_ALKEH|nr:hypothetical protein [Alkalilimnicola ehrlichii]ABI57264.1 hypothetical protein Mlg_1922 [Alkalilimnicola ehrlichii MLHE-1]